MPVRLTIGIPKGGLGHALNDMARWLEATLGKDGFAWVPSGQRGMDATHLYLPDLATAQAFADRWPVVGIEVRQPVATKDIPSRA